MDDSDGVSPPACQDYVCSAGGASPPDVAAGLCPSTIEPLLGASPLASPALGVPPAGGVLDSGTTASFDETLLRLCGLGVRQNPNIDVANVIVRGELKPQILRRETIQDVRLVLE